MNKIFTVFLLLISSTMFSQEARNVIDSTLINSDYFHDYPQEKIFVHTNKTLYFSGEKIWWKAYVVSDSDDKPILTTSNLHVNFYDSQKKLISSQLFDCIDGKSFGEIKLSKDIKTGTYYIQLDTQWNRNFNNAYVSKINVVNTFETSGEVALADSEPNTEGISINTDAPLQTVDVNFYPESGTLLNNAANVIYFTVTNNDLYVANQDVEIQDKASGKTIASVKTNAFGVGAFNVFSLPDHNYILKFKRDAKDYSFKLNGAVDSGIVISKETSEQDSDKAHFKITLSNDLSKKYSDQNLFATVHRNQKLLYILPIKIDKKHIKYSIPVAKAHLFNGVNTITLFNANNKPVAERHFYVETKNEIKIDVKQKEVVGDSLGLDFNIKGSAIASNLSISVLPQDTKLNADASNIVEGFLLDPYVDKSVPSGLSLSKTDLDVFLQVNKGATTTYQLNNDKPIFNIENGLEVKGVVNANIKEDYKVMLSSTVNGILEVTKINSDKSFQFKNLVLKDSSDYKLSLINKKGGLLDATFYVYDSKSNYKPNDVLAYSKPDLKTTLKQAEPVNDSSELIYRGSEVLETVNLEGNKAVDDKRKPRVWQETASIRALEFSEVQESMYNVIQYLRIQPTLFVSKGQGSMGQKYDIGFRRKGGNALIVLNGALTYAGMLENIQLSDVASIRVSPTAYVYGYQGAMGAIYVDLKEAYEYDRGEAGHKYFVSNVDFGFTRPALDFERPLFTFNTKSSKQFYNTLDWIPNFDVSPNTSNSLQVYKGDHDKIKLFINGMNEKGEVFSEVVDVPVKASL
ncbi:hypothetical protein [Formosa sp. L2A11]|uniref:hypothetical protein n=1 Tax=Formosa sp. L2A11 TaxID=2686363 RepID=UPI00131C2CAE|nr:hypothetical protein [Formosa sp. L2A11]